MGDILRGNGGPVAHTSEDGGWGIEEVHGCVDFGDSPSVHDADAVVADDGSKTIWSITKESMS